VNVNETRRDHPYIPSGEKSGAMILRTMLVTRNAIIDTRYSNNWEDDLEDIAPMDNQ
jgi:hypothetical protein